MTRLTQIIALASVAAVVVSGIPSAIAAGNTPRDPVMAQQGGSRANQQGQRGQQGQMGQRGQAGQAGSRLSDQDRQRVRATDQQLRQMRDGSAAGSAARRAATNLERSASGSGFNSRDARAHAQNLGDQVRSMMQSHDQLNKSMSNAQRRLLSDRTRDPNRSRDKIQDRLNDLNQALGMPNPDPAQVGKRAGQLRAEMEQWHERLRELGLDMGIEFRDGDNR